MKRYLKVLGMVVVFSVFVLSLVSDAVDFKEAIIGKWFEDKGDKQLEFFKEGTVIMDGTPVDYKFIDDNRISLDFVSIRIVYEVSKEGNLILNDGEVNKYLTEKAKEAQIKAEEKRENAELGKRFTVSDLTILDKDTKLMWTRDADIAGKEMKWEEAFKIISEAVDPDAIIKFGASIDPEQKDELRPVFESQSPKGATYFVSFEALSENDMPVIITQNEFMRRMKDMSKLGGGGMGFYGDMPDSYNLVINSNHPLIQKIQESKDKKLGEKITRLNEEIKPVEAKRDKLQKEQDKKKEDEVKQEEKDKLAGLNKQLNELKDKKKEMLTDFGQKNKIVKQVIDLALLANNMLKGQSLTEFVKRSVDLIK